MISGCVSTVELQSIDEAQAKVGNRSTIIYLKSGQEYRGKNVQVGNDSVGFVDNEIEDTLHFSNRDIKFIGVNDHAAGSVEGFLIGGTISFALGAAIASTSDNPGFPPSLQAMFVGIGGLPGIIIGGLSGHSYSYILPEDSVKAGIEKSIHAQDTIRDVVYLKNGSIVNGFMTIDTTANAGIKIHTPDDSLFVYNTSEVEKIEKGMFTRTPSPDIRYTPQTIDKGCFHIGLQTGLKSTFQLSRYYNEVNKYPEDWMIGIGAIYSLPSGLDFGASISYYRLKYDMGRDDIEVMNSNEYVTIINDGIARMYGLSLFFRSYSSHIEKLPVAYFLARFEYNYVIIPDKYLTDSYGATSYTYKTPSARGSICSVSVGGGVIFPIAGIVRLLPELYVSKGNGLFLGWGFAVDVKL